MIYNQFYDGQVTLSDGVTSFVHLDDAVETSIQAIHFENGIYNVADDAPVKGSEFAEWYKEQLASNQILIFNLRNHLNVA